MSLPLPSDVELSVAKPVMADEAFESLTTAFLAHGRATPDHLAQVFAADPGHIGGWAAKAMFSVMMGRFELLPAAREAAGKARLSLNERGGSVLERLYTAAAESASTGDWLATIQALEAILDEQPDDSLAAKLSHGFRFMLGDREGMRTSIDRVIGRVGLGHRHAGFLLGCKAFALEEAGVYREAEFVGRSAVEREPMDAWGMHAVSHIHEMTGRLDDGVRWIETRIRNFDHCNNFRYHLFWHLALFRLETGDCAEVLRLYDENIRADRTDDFRDVANAASLLQRLEIAGADVGERWEELAALSEKRVQDRSLVFADLHYVMALAGAGRITEVESLASSLAGGGARNGMQSEISCCVGGEAAGALIDYRAGRFAEAAQRLIAIRSGMRQIGGSHAQRDVFEQVMIDAAVKSGHPEARTLLLGRLGNRQGRNRFADDRLKTGTAAAMLNAVALSIES